MGLGNTPEQLDAERRTNQYGLSRKHIFDSVKASLERLQLDYIDVLQCHRFDPNTPIEETMQALHDVVKAGYVRYIGMSSCKAYECAFHGSIVIFQSMTNRLLIVHIMQNYAITNKLTPFITMQNHYNALYREEEREMMPTLKVRYLYPSHMLSFCTDFFKNSTLTSALSPGLLLLVVFSLALMTQNLLPHAVKQIA
jgi:aryl-alcohol dehydrogenase-like predicted oxidoreductase